MRLLTLEAIYVFGILTLYKLPINDSAKALAMDPKASIGCAGMRTLPGFAFPAGTSGDFAAPSEIAMTKMRAVQTAPATPMSKAALPRGNAQPTQEPNPICILTLPAPRPPIA